MKNSQKKLRRQYGYVKKERMQNISFFSKKKGGKREKKIL